MMMYTHLSKLLDSVLYFDSQILITKLDNSLQTTGVQILKRPAWVNFGRNRDLYSIWPQNSGKSTMIGNFPINTDYADNTAILDNSILGAIILSWRLRVSLLSM